MPEKIYTAETAASEDLLQIQEDFSMNGEVKYKLTEGELEWIEFIKGKYSIADYLLERYDADTGIVTLDQELSKVLDDDCRGAGKAVMLSDDTMLQGIFFYCYSDPEIDMELDMEFGKGKEVTFYFTKEEEESIDAFLLRALLDKIVFDNLEPGVRYTGRVIYYSGYGWVVDPWEVKSDD